MFVSNRSDTESADVKAAKLQKKKFNIAMPAIFKTNKQVVADDEEQQANANDDANDDAARSEATVVMEDDPPKKVCICIVTIYSILTKTQFSTVLLLLLQNFFDKPLYS